MAELLVIGYDSVDEAEQGRTELFGLRREYLVEVGDAVVATRDSSGKIKLNQMVGGAARGGVVQNRK